MDAYRSFRHKYGLIAAVVLCLCLPGFSVLAQKPAGANRNVSSERYVTIDFNDVDINVFIKFISELTDTNFIIDDRVKGNVTIISPSRISINEAFRVFESVLEVHGFTTVPSGKVTKIVPAPDARTRNIKTLLKKNALSPEDRVITQIIPLTYADADEIKRLFTPLVSKNSVILSYPATNMLIVTDVQSNIARLIRILEAIDITGIGHEISVVPIIHSDAVKMAQLLESVFAPSLTKGKKGTAIKTLKFVPEERTNTIVMLASEVDTERARRLIAMLDKEVPEGKEKIHVYYLENAQAEDLAKVLQALPTKAAPVGKTGKKTAPVVPETVKITADKATNALIIMAEKDDYMVLEEVIKKLDIPRSMVFIESVIMEVNVEKDFSIGVEWAAFGEIGNQEGILGTGFSGSDSFANTTDFLAGQGLPDGFSIGAFKDIISVTTPDGVQNFASLSAMVQAFSQDKDVHFLSTPQLLTTDNEEATIVVGRNVPFQTRSAAEAGLETYSSFEYRDVGITLKITPHVTQERMVQLDISEEISKIDEVATALGSTDRPTTLKRTIETSVIVADQNTVVIGGLIDDSFSETETKVPFLGDIPLLGWLFKSRKTGTERSNLFIFLTPKVVANPAESAQILREKQVYMQEQKEQSIKLYNDRGRRTPQGRAPAEIPE